MRDVDRELAAMAEEIARTKATSAKARAPSGKAEQRSPPDKPADPSTRLQPPPVTPRRSPRFKPVLGIDFGTSNTCASWVDGGGNIRVVPVDEGQGVLPTVVWFAAKDRFVLGEGARQKMIDAPATTIYGFKRFLGRAFNSEFVGRHKDRFPYKIVAGADGTTAVEVLGEAKPLKDLTVCVMQRMVELARADAGQDFDDCVLSVPAHYTYPQRRVIRTAAEMAGLEVRALVNEPTAAALFYSKQRSGDGTALIYDLGGGTFDATLISIENDVVKVLATGGDAFLGGADFDERMAQAVASEFERKHGVDLRPQKVVMQRLIFACEQAKIALSHQEQAIVRVLFAAEKDSNPLDVDHPLTRDQLEVILAPLVERTMGACEDLLRIACMDADDVDEVILVGGQTRTPFLRRRVLGAFKFDPNKNLNPELTVCAGSAIMGRALELQSGPSLVDVVGIPLWLSIPGVGVRPVIAAQSAVPCVRRLTVEQRPQTGGPMTLVVFEALEPTNLDRVMLGKIPLDPEWLRANPGPIHLEFMMTQNFSLQVVVGGSSGTRKSITLT